MGHHQERYPLTRQILLEPFYHLYVEMVGRLIKYKHLGLLEQHLGESDPFQLASGECGHRLSQVGYLELMEHPRRPVGSVKVILT